ncbi:hypothetical protein ACHAXS_000909 [Conticribra weissflogii]
MVDNGILQECGASKRALPCFVIPIKDDHVRQISDLWLLNNCVKCEKYPLPVIQDIIQNISGFKYFTKLDIFCNITPLNSTKSPKTSASSLHLLASININVYQWDSSAIWILHNKLWKKSLVDWTMSKYILAILASLQTCGKNSSCCMIKLFLVWKQMDSLLTPSNVNGLFMKWICSVIG